MCILWCAFWVKFENLNVDFVENFLMELTTTKEPLKCQCCTKCFEWNWQQQKSLWSVNIVLNVLNKIYMNKNPMSVGCVVNFFKMKVIRKRENKKKTLNVKTAENISGKIDNKDFWIMW